MKVWIIDDEPEIRQVLEFILQRDGHKVECFETPLPALEKFKSEQPEFCVCDFKMPQMNGLDFYMAIREKWSGHFIMLTGEPSADPNELKNLGIKEVLFKPRDLTRLSAVIKDLSAK